MTPYSFHPEAIEEAGQAVRFYEERQTGLGSRFLDALEDTLVRIQRNPRLYRKVFGDLRKCRILRFPYGIIFRDRGEHIEIIAVMHLKKKPGYWKSRLS